MITGDILHETHELAYFTDNVQQIIDFYRTLLGKEPVAQSEDMDGVCQTLVKQGLVMEIPPKDYYWGRSAYLRDPDGHQVEITREER